MIKVSYDCRELTRAWFQCKVVPSFFWFGSLAQRVGELFISNKILDKFFIPISQLVICIVDESNSKKPESPTFNEKRNSWKVILGRSVSI